MVGGHSAAAGALWSCLLVAGRELLSPALLHEVSDAAFASTWLQRIELVKNDPTAVRSLNQWVLVRSADATEFTMRVPALAGPGAQSVRRRKRPRLAL